MFIAVLFIVFCFIIHIIQYILPIQKTEQNSAFPKSICKKLTSVCGSHYFDGPINSNFKCWDRCNNVLQLDSYCLSFSQFRIVTAVKRVEFVSDKKIYIALRGRWCNMNMLNAHASTDEKNDDSKDTFFRN
jgi:hypothetical protein